MMIGVGVQAGDEKSLLRETLPQATEHPAGGFRVIAPVEQARGQGVNPQELGLVVQHLLEMGNDPAPVGAVAEEASLKVVVQTAGTHGIQGRFDDQAECGALRRFRGRRRV